MINFFNESGSAIGRFVGEAGNAYIKYLTSWIDIGRSLISGGILDAITNTIEVITNLQTLAVDSGAVKGLAEFLKGMSDVLKTLTGDGKYRSYATTVVTSIRGFAEELVKTLDFLVKKTPIIEVASKLISSVFDFFSNLQDKELIMMASEMDLRT